MNPSLKWMTPYFELMKNQNITDLFFNGYSACFSLKNENFSPLVSPFQNNAQMHDMLQELAHFEGIRLDPQSPSGGGIVLNGLIRWHAVLPPASPRQPLLTLRYQKVQTTKKLVFDDPKNLLPDIVKLTESGKNILICGPTGSGKTTLLQRLLTSSCLNERVLILEEIEEIKHENPLWINMCSRKKSIEKTGGISFQFLMNEAMRLRPDRIVCGELRGQDSFLFLELILTGHNGCYATLHAENTKSAAARLRKNNKNIPINTAEIWGVFLKRKALLPEIVGLERILDSN